MKKKKNYNLLKVFIIFVMIGIASYACYLGNYYYNESQKTTNYYLASENQYGYLLNDKLSEVSIPRGTLLVVKDLTDNVNGIELHKVFLDDKTYYTNMSNLKENREDCVLEKTLYSLRDTVLREDFDVNSFIISGFVKKNTELQVLDYANLLDDGSVDYYFVSDNNQTGYVSNNYLSSTYYETSLDSSIYKGMNTVGNDPTLIDYYDDPKGYFEDNIMPDEVNALYINSGCLNNVDNYISIAKRCKINAFVVDIRDCYLDTQLGYNSEVTKRYSPSTDYIMNTVVEYQHAIRKLKNNGFYVIGRISAFNDVKLALDHPEWSLTYPNGQYYVYSSIYWPSAFNTNVWQYDVELALEAVDLMGFNEIQFDYIRTPEYVPSNIDRKNTYDQYLGNAIINFLRYARDELHKKHVYISADVFGETSGWRVDKPDCYLTVYGQFYPAISNVVDVISSMAYPDHYGYGYSYGIDKPWEHPYELLYNYGLATKQVIGITYNPAKNRTWILAQNTAYGNYYAQNEVGAQINALNDVAKGDQILYGGFMTWNAGSNSLRYESCIPAFK